MPPFADSRCESQSSGAHRQHARWQLLPDELWTHIATFLGTYDKLNLERTCTQLNAMFVNPHNRDTWGKLDLTAPKVISDMQLWGLCEWLQRRLAGISGISFKYGSVMNEVETEVTSKMWHALVASTSGTDIRLRVCSRAGVPGSMLAGPMHAELVQRLTALDICVASAWEIAQVHSLTALRHLRLCDHPDARVLAPDEGAGGGTWRCQMSSLRSLYLQRIPPAAFFTPGSAAGLHRLQMLCLQRCEVAAPQVSYLPAELLRLPALRRLDIVNAAGQRLRMPDLRGLPALQDLSVSNGPRLGFLRGTPSSALIASLAGGPLCGATGLTRLRLSSIVIDTQECAESIERLPHLKELFVEYSTCDDAAFWATKLQRQLRGRCSVRPATECRATHWSCDDW